MDAYTLRARLAPALIAALPLAIAVTAFFPEGLSGWTALWSTIAACGGTYLLAEIGRQGGKSREENLYSLWGGRPTSLRLSHSAAPNKDTLERYHKRIEELLPDLTLPSKDDEAQDLRTALATYEAACAFLRQRTRDKKKFPHVHQANMEYGFRRNTWGLKPAGLSLAVLALAGHVSLVAFHDVIGAPISTPLSFVAAFINAALGMFWALRINPDWVKTTAFAYADRLLESLDSPDLGAS